MNGFRAIVAASWRQLCSRPIYYLAIFFWPVFAIVFLTSLMGSGLPEKVPAAIVDKDRTHLSRTVTQNLAGMQLVELTQADESYTQARRDMQEGKIYGFFLIPENFEADLLAGRKPVISFYYNMTYFVPGSLLYKTFKSTAIYTKAGVMTQMGQSAGVSEIQMKPMLQPVNIVSRPLANPELNYAIYLCNSFVPACMQLMIMMVTCFSLGQLVKYKLSPRLLQMADGSVLKALTGWLLPQTLLWFVVVIFMESWLFRWCHYPMNGSWFWLTLSQLMFVLASQGAGLFFYGLLPNLRLSLSASALTGILTFSVAAFSFPEESMYGGVAIFSYLMPARYNFLIYIDQALNGLHVAYSRYWFVAYLAWMLLPFVFIRRVKKAMIKPVYVP